MIRKIFGRFFFLSLAFSMVLPGTVHDSYAQKAKSSSSEPQEILLDIQRELLELDKQFEVIRKDLFFPKAEEVLFYLRNRLEEDSQLKNLDLYINGRRVHQHVYTETETIAFHFSSLQPLFRMDLRPGSYRLRARVVLGKGKGRVYEHQFILKKENLPRFVEFDLAYDRKKKAIVLAKTVH